MKIIYKKKISNKDIKRIINKPFGICSGDNKIYMLEKRNKEIEIIKEYIINSQPNSIASNGDEIIIGCLNGDVLYKKGESEMNVLYKHTNNVCSIDIKNGIIFSGSWDHDGILYKMERQENENEIENNIISKEYESEKTKKINFEKAKIKVISGGKISEKTKKRHLRHPGSVWCSKIISDEELITGCADGIIRKYLKGKINEEIAYHNGPVRGIILEKEIIYSIDNNGGIFKINKTGELIRSRFIDEQLYCIYIYKEYLVVGGEQGILIFLNKDLEIIKKKKLETHAVWDICEYMGSLFIACGEGIIYELNKDGEEIIEEKKEKKVEDSEFESGGINYKIINGEVFYETKRGWESIGNAVGKYDHSFTINLKEKNYTLSFNNKDNIQEVARKFLYENKLGNEFYKEIVDYIEKNFKKNSLFKKDENIDIEGIKRKIGEHKIINYLERIQKSEYFSDLISIKPNIYEIEHILFKGIYDNANTSLNQLPFFIVLDICRFLISKGFFIDTSFLFRISISNIKEAKAFLSLLTNLLTKLPFNYIPLDKKINKFKDEGYLTLYNLMNYNENKRLISKN